MKRLILCLLLIPSIALGADYDGDKKSNEIVAHGGSVATTTRIFIQDPVDTDIVTYMTVQEALTAGLGAAHDTEAELTALFAARPDTTGTINAEELAIWSDSNTLKAYTYAELAAIAGFEAALEGVLDIADLQGYAAAMATKEDTLTNEAGLYAALSDVTQFYEPGDDITGVDGQLLDLSSISHTNDTNEGLILPTWNNVTVIGLTSGAIAWDEDTDALKIKSDAGWQTLGATAAPVDAQYLTLATNATLTQERVLTAGAGIDITDAGAGSTLTIDGETGTVTNPGILELATNDEAITGTDTDRAVTPDGVMAVLEGGTFNLTNSTITFGLEAGDIPDISATYEVQLTNEAGLYAVLSDVSDFMQPGDAIDGSVIGGVTPDAATFTTISAGANGFSVDADGDTTVKTITVTQTADPGILQIREGSAGGTDYRGFTVPAALTQSLYYELPDGNPTANDVFLIGAAAAGESALSYGTLSTDNFDITSGSITIKDLGVSVAEINASGTPGSGNYLRGDGSWQSVTASPAGSDTQIQYNASGSLGAEAALTYNATTNTLMVILNGTNEGIELGDGTHSPTNTTSFYTEGAIEVDGVSYLDGNVEVGGDLTVAGSFDIGDLAASSGNNEFSISPDTDATDTLVLRGYDVDGAAFDNMVTITNANTPTLDLAADGAITVTSSGSTVTVEGVVFTGDALSSITTITASGAITGGTVTDGTVTLAGDGTITGVSVGGLPDNIVDNGMMADDAVTDAEWGGSDWETFTVLSPADGDDPLIGPMPIGITVTSIKCVTLGGGDIDVDLQECDANGANCATGGIAVANVSTTTVTDTSFTDAAIDADDYLKAVLTNSAGTVDQLACNFEFTR